MNIITLNGPPKVIEFCCYDMSKNYHSGLIVLKCNGSWRGMMSYCQFKDVGITHCPWCGEEITLVEECKGPEIKWSDYGRMGGENGNFKD